MSCPMIRTAVTSVCQLRDIVSHRNLIIALEWRKGERERRSTGFEPHRKLPCSAALRLSVRSGEDRDPQENKIDPVRCTGTHSFTEIIPFIRVNSWPHRATPARVQTGVAQRKDKDIKSHLSSGLR